MTERDATATDSRIPGVLAALIVVGLLLLPVFYVLSMGPFIWLDAKGYIHVAEDSLIVSFYWPILWSAENFKFAETMLDWYVELWDET